ncbi:MAG: tetratricopeptide repeat protein, partial [Pirellulales bacterium]|nr:tetratricopeptide repeat protein [Pirellulales bacterium]
MQTRLPEIVSRPVFALLVLLLVVLAPCASGDEAEDQYRVAAGHYARGRWELAAEEFGTFLARFPSHPKADQSVFFTAEARLQQRRADEAAERFAEYLRRTPEGPYARVARFRLGEAAYLAGRLDQARLDLEAFYREYPDDPLDAFVLPYLGEIELAQDAAAKAADHFRLALKRFPDSKMNQRCRLGLARSLQGLDQPDEALRLYEALAAEGLGPLSAEARFRLGALEYAQGAYRDAIATLRQLDEALDASRWQPRARLVRAMGLRKLKQFDEAAALLEGLSTDPTVGVEAQYWLAAVRKDQQQWDAAAAILLTTAQKNPNHPLIPAIRFHAGHALLRAKRIAEATEQFDRVLAIDQEDNAWLDDAAMGKIQLAIQQQDPGAVDRQARQFLECFSDSPLADDVRRTWARSLLARAECGQAVDVLRPLVERDDHKPGSLETSYLLALAYRGNGQTREALDCLAPVVSAAKTTSSPWAEACLLHAALSIELGQFDDAVDPLETLLEADPPGDLAAQARAQLAVSLAKSEKWKSAAAQFDTLAAGHPAHPILPPTAEQLAEIAYAAGDWPRAAKQFTWLVDHAEQEPYVNRGLSGLGWTRFRQGQYDQAAATFQRLLDRKPEPRLAAHAARACGHVLEQLGRLEAALAVYQRAIDEYPTSREQADVMLAAARLHGRLGHHDQAATLYESTAKDFPASDQLDTILYEWSWMLTDAQRSDEATALWERLHKDFPESRYWADATYRLAQRAATAGDR